MTKSQGGNSMTWVQSSDAKIKKDKDKPDKDKDKDKKKKGFFGGTKSKKDDSQWDYIDVEFQKTYLSKNEDYWFETKEHHPSLQELEALAKSEGIVFNSMNARTGAQQSHGFIATNPSQRFVVPGGRTTASVESESPGANPAHSWGARSLDSPSRAPSGAITVTARAGSTPPTPTASGGPGFGVPPARAVTGANINVGVRPAGQQLQPLSASTPNARTIARPIDIPTHRAGAQPTAVLQPNPTMGASGHRQFFSPQRPQGSSDLNQQPVQRQMTDPHAGHTPSPGQSSPVVSRFGVPSPGGSPGVVARPVGRFQPGGVDSQTLPVRPVGVTRYQTEGMAPTSPDTPRPVVNRYQTQTDFTSSPGQGSPVVSRFGVPSPGGSPGVGLGARAQIGSLPSTPSPDATPPARPVGRYSPAGGNDSGSFSRPGGAPGVARPNQPYTPQTQSFGVRPGQGAR